MLDRCFAHRRILSRRNLIQNSPHIHLKYREYHYILAEIIEIYLYHVLICVAKRFRACYSDISYSVRYTLYHFSVPHHEHTT